MKIFDTIGVHIAALRNFSHQTAHHGYPLHSTGLPPTSTGVTLQYFIQEVLLDWMEAGHAAPATIILWTKSPQKVRIFADLLNIVNFPSLRITLQYLEDLQCPPLAQICPTTQPWSITQKAVRLARWLEPRRTRGTQTLSFCFQFGETERKATRHQDTKRKARKTTHEQKTKKTARTIDILSH